MTADKPNDSQYELTSGLDTTKGMIWALFGIVFLTIYAALTAGPQSAAQLARTGMLVCGFMIFVEFASWAVTQVGYRWGSYPRTEGEVE